MARYISTFFFRALKDLFRRVKKLPSEPIVINPKELRVWMIGHATLLINLYGTTILTDPVLVKTIPFPKRLVAHGYEADELPPLDYVVVSHAHMDHLNKPSLKYLADKTKTVILSKNCGDLVKGMGFKQVVELDWGEKFNTGDVTIIAHKTEHWGRRVPWERMKRGSNSFIFEKFGKSVFFGGDTGYGAYFKEIGKEHKKIDVALLPIGAYNPDIFRIHHMDPQDALHAALDLNAQHIIPIHWGNFRLSLESLFEPPELFLELAKERGMLDKAHLLNNGESFAAVCG